MINTLYLPELRDMLAAGNAVEMREFCTALHPARTAEFMEGLTSDEAWAVMQHADLDTRTQIFSYLDVDKQHDILVNQDVDQVAQMVAEISPDDRVDALQDLDPETLARLLERLPTDDRRNFLRLSQYREGTAGAVMTSEVAKLSETLTINEALNEIARQSEEYETIYYLYIVDDEDHLRGLVSARQLLAGMRHPNTLLRDIMDSDLVTVDVMDHQEDVANKVAKLDLLAIPVVDAEHRMLGIITHDDVIDVLREEATEDAHRIAAVDPLDESYLKTPIITLSWKRGMWLGILFFCALLTASALQNYQAPFSRWVWLVPFIPLVISSGGNSGSQSATLIITALNRGHITLQDWLRVICRELAMGLLLGVGLGTLGFFAAMVFIPGNEQLSHYATLVIPITLVMVTVAGTLTGSILPLIFEKLGWDPAMMSNPFVSGIVDIIGILIYVNIALLILE